MLIKGKAETIFTMPQIMTIRIFSCLSLPLRLLIFIANVIHSLIQEKSPIKLWTKIGTSTKKSRGNSGCICTNFCPKFYRTFSLSKTVHYICNGDNVFVLMVNLDMRKFWTLVSEAFFSSLNEWLSYLSEILSHSVICT